jgi:hypothetical protein
MYEINPVVMLSQTSVATNMVLTSSTNVFTADHRIAVLEQEIFNLRNAKRTFDGVEILKPAHANKPVPTEQSKAPESMTKTALPLSQPAPAEKPTTTTQLPLHPFTNIKEMSYPLTSATLLAPPPNQLRIRSQQTTCSPYPKPVHCRQCLQQVDASTPCHSITRGVIHHIPRSP